MKKIIATLSLFALAFAVAPAGAATISSVADSTASIRHRLSSMLTLNNNNEALIQNQVVSSANTGHNGNTSVGFQSQTGITTGNATAVVDVANTANEISVDSSMDFTFGTGEGDAIDNIWDGSTVRIRHSLTDTQEINNNNAVAAANALVVDSNTGDNGNASDEGLQNSSITTGAAASGVGVANSFNRINEMLTRMVR